MTWWASSSDTADPRRRTPSSSGRSRSRPVNAARAPPPRCWTRLCGQPPSDRSRPPSRRTTNRRTSCSTRAPTGGARRCAWPASSPRASSRTITKPKCCTGSGPSSPLRLHKNRSAVNVFESVESEVRSYCRGWPVVFDRGVGAWLYDEDGNGYLDFFAGAGALNYGHNNPVLKQVVIDYLQREGVKQA